MSGKNSNPKSGGVLAGAFVLSSQEFVLTPSPTAGRTRVKAASWCGAPLGAAKTGGEGGRPTATHHYVAIASALPRLLTATAAPAQ